MALLRLSLLAAMGISQSSDAAQSAASRLQEIAQQQAAAASEPKFEVASIRECRQGEQPSSSAASPKTLILSCWPLWRVIADAYRAFATGSFDAHGLVVPMPLQGTPVWANQTRYSIRAKVDRAESPAMMRGPMMQALLEERFHLKVHHEVREVEAYMMTAATSGLKLKRTEEGGCTLLDPSDPGQSAQLRSGDKPWCNFPSTTPKGTLAVFDGHGITLENFAKFLHPDGRPVVDRTGESGAFEIHLEWEPNVPRPATAPPEEPEAPGPPRSLAVALREQLGLQLVPGRASIEFLILDHLERPSEN